MRPSQRRAVNRIIRYIRRNSSKRYSLRIEIEPLKESRSVVVLKTRLRWDGADNQLGKDCEDSGCFWIGPKGGIIVLTYWAGVYRKDNVQHVAYVLGARTGYKDRGKQLYHKPQTGSKTRRVWDIADANPDKSRKEILALCAAERLNANMAKTQYGRWRKHRKTIYGK